MTRHSGITLTETIRVILIIGVIMACLAPCCVEAKNIDRLQRLLEKKNVIKVYVADVINSTGDNKIDINKLKASIEKAFASRKAVDFDISKTTDGADIAVHIDVVEYIWLKNDPIDMIAGVAGVVYDTVKQEHYARMTINAEVINTKNNAALWKDRVKATITDQKMTEEQSYSMMDERMAKVFLQYLLKKRLTSSRDE